MINLILTTYTFFCFPDSAKWLYSKKMYSECASALREMASFNGIQSTDLEEKLKILESF